LGSLTHALAQSAGNENIQLNLQQIVVNPHKNGYIINYTNALGKHCTITSNKVISTIGAYSLHSLLPFIPKTELDKITSLHYTKVIQLVIGFKQWEGRPLDGFGGLIPSVENRNLLGILYMSSLFEGRAPEGGALLSIFMGGMRRQDVMSLSDNEIKEIVKRECKDLLSLQQFNPDLFKIIRYEHAIPQYGVESGERFETIEKLETRYPGLSIGGNLKNGIGMADRIQQGKDLLNLEKSSSYYQTKVPNKNT
jgi:oxygen-dependent protoporphyrinogen oxidase